MAIRIIRQTTDEILRKKSREVEIVDDKIREILVDIHENHINEDHYPIKRVLAFLFAQGRRTIEKSGGIWYNNKNKQRVLFYGK